MASEHTAVHLLAGGAGGTAGAVITCPLEVVKTRLQSSVHVSAFSTYIPQNNGQGRVMCPQTIHTANYSTCPTTTTQSKLIQSQARSSTGIYQCLKHIIQHEGPKALFKGLGPNLVGVAPSRAIYFYSYAQSKSFFNDSLNPETPVVHICSAAVAGFTASTATNPIWFIKTRLQLDHKKNGSLTTMQCIRDVYRKMGIKGFYKGITASYYGISETVIHFVIYEAIKAKLRDMKGHQTIEDDFDERSAVDFLEFMAAGATSKTIATCVAYPHEVARTRLREEGNKYRTFWQTLHRVFLEEGHRGLYRGLATQLVRQIPNTAIMMSTYEAVVYFCHKHVY